MQKRYQVVHVPHVALLTIEPGKRPPSAPIDQYCYRIEDSLAGGDYVGGPYFHEAEAEAACDRLNKEN